MTHNNLLKDVLAVLTDCDEAMSYMSEYDIPICLPDDVKRAKNRLRKFIEDVPEDLERETRVTKSALEAGNLIFDVSHKAAKMLAEAVADYGLINKSPPMEPPFICIEGCEAIEAAATLLKILED